MDERAKNAATAPHVIPERASARSYAAPCSEVTCARLPEREREKTQEMVREPTLGRNFAAPGHLVAVLANPPGITNGDRSRRRIEQAQTSLGLTSSTIVNLFPLPTYRTGEISLLGSHQGPWISARPPILRVLRATNAETDAVLLGYGVSEPTGAARELHRFQVSWLRQQLDFLKLTIYVVGDGPRHPSRWHRYTSRHYAGLPFDQALANSLRQLDG